MIKSSPEEKIIFNSEYELLEYVSRAIREADAWRYTATRLDDAHKYVQKYCMIEGWGRNVWHTILDDAIRMKKLYEPSSEQPSQPKSQPPRP